MLKKISAFILVVAVLLSLGITASATQANYLVDYTGDYVYTATQGYGQEFYLKAAPDYDLNGFPTATAAGLSWSVVSGSIPDINILQTTTQQIDATHYIAVAKVSVSGSSPAGAASIKAVDADGAYVNFTIIVNYDDGEGDAEDIICKFYSVDSSGIETNLTTVTGLIPVWDTYESDINYTTVIDGLEAARLDSTSLVTAVSINESGYVQSISIGNVPYTGYTDPVTYDYFGWQYRVYRYDSNQNTYNLLPITEYIGADQFALIDGDVVVWKYGKYGVVSFPNSITP